LLICCPRFYTGRGKHAKKIFFVKPNVQIEFLKIRPRRRERHRVFQPRMDKDEHGLLARCRKNGTMMPMKLALAVLVYSVIGLVLSWGILLLLAGKPWLFIVASLAYVVAFGKIGCQAH